MYRTSKDLAKTLSQCCFIDCWFTVCDVDPTYASYGDNDVAWNSLNYRECVTCHIFLKAVEFNCVVLYSVKLNSLDLQCFHLAIEYNEVWGGGTYVTLFSLSSHSKEFPVTVTAFHRIGHKPNDNISLISTMVIYYRVTLLSLRLTIKLWSSMVYTQWHNISSHNNNTINNNTYLSNYRNWPCTITKRWANAVLVYPLHPKLTTIYKARL